MTTWNEYQTLPSDNNSAPPVGAPEGMPPSAVDDVMREMMSVTRQLGDEAITNGLNTLADMAHQSSNAVSITGGSVTGVTLGGNGAGVYALQAPALQGVVPSSCLQGYYNINVSHANDADTIGGLNINAIVPIGIIVMYYGSLGSVDTNHWALCDGSRGTPDLRNRFVIGAGNDSQLTAGGGGTTDVQGAHSHGGNTAGHTLTIAEMPYHDHGFAGQNVVYYQGAQGVAAGPFSVGYGITFTGQGGDTAHSHGIGSDGAHAHNVPLPPYFGLYYLMRVA